MFFFRIVEIVDPDNGGSKSLAASTCFVPSLIAEMSLYFSSKLKVLRFLFIIDFLGSGCFCLFDGVVWQAKHDKSGLSSKSPIQCISSLSDRCVRLRNHCVRLENHYVRLENYCMRN